MIIDILLLVALIAFMLLFFVEKEQNADLDYTLTTYKISKQQEVAELKMKIEELEGRDKIVRIEKFVARPTTITSKFDIMTEFIEDQNVFKNVVIREMAREIAEQIYLNPYAYQLFFFNNCLENHEKVEIRMRFLPYPEAAVWEEVK